jgi:hypothetical protein
MANEYLLLTDPMTDPKNILESVLGKKHKIFENFVSKITEMGLVLEWNYYKDQKCWLCKVLNKKKNICWLSVWNIGFKLTFYFTEKTIDGVYELDIDDEIKKFGHEMKPVGKLRPLLFLVDNNKIIKDSIKLLDYKIKLK